jgi:hypothetical protein
MALPNDVEYQIQDFGLPCSATVSGSVLSFYGILDTHQANVPMDNGSFSLQTAYTTLTVLPSIADELPRNSYITVVSGSYQVRDKLLADDGSISHLIIARG